METSIIFAVAIIFFVLIIIAKGVKIVPQSDLYVIERLGKFNKELHGGFHLIIPVVDKVRAILTSREQLVDINKQSVITKDNVNISRLPHIFQTNALTKGFPIFKGHYFL